MLPDGLDAPVNDLLQRLGLGTPSAAVPLAGGRNNRVFRLDLAGPATGQATGQAPGQAVVLKSYFRAAGDRQDRLRAEVSFTRFLWAGGVTAAPQPLAADDAAQIALFEWIDGRLPAPAEIDRGAVEQAVAFFQAVNRLERGDAARALPDGAEACFSIAAHLATVQRRLERLAGLDDADAAGCVRFVVDRVLPAFAAQCRRLQAEAGSLGLDLAATLPPAERCLSPSDFGFHNALRDAAGRYRFIDFEYAGWDDPAKTIGDFFHQVRTPVPREHYPWVADAVAALGPAPERTRRRCDLLLPVYGYKWLAIVLNEFLPAGDQRRRFAGAGDAAAERRRHQLALAEAALTQLTDGAIPTPLGV